ncbi:hypothetical protein WI27_27170 [Burkholderia cepacia]|nr:hypothetical protein WI27_27170 [Burkholderia cepacia]
MENFVIRAFTLKSQSSVARVRMRMPNLHHPRDNLMGKSRMRRRVCGMDRRTNRFFYREITAFDIHFVEHFLFDDIRRAFIPMRIIMIQTDRQDGSRTHVGTAPPPSAIHESQAEIKVGVFHESSRAGASLR